MEEDGPAPELAGQAPEEDNARGATADGPRSAGGPAPETLRSLLHGRAILTRAIRYPAQLRAAGATSPGSIAAFTVGMRHAFLLASGVAVEAMFISIIRGTRREPEPPAREAVGAPKAGAMT